MLKITIVALGKIKEKPLEKLIEEYVKRLGRYAKIQVIELLDQPVPPHPSKGEIERVLLQEEKEILKKIGEKAWVVSLCIEGKEVDSQGMANWLSAAAHQTSEMVFVLGSSHGLSDEIKKRSQWLLSLSKMTFPHNLARLMLLEQLYRSFKMLQGEPYHK